MEKLPQLQHQVQEITAAKEAHLLIAQNTLDVMKEVIERSTEQFKILQRWRIKAIFLPRGFARRVYRIAWRIACSFFKLVLIVDYQMVYFF